MVWQEMINVFSGSGRRDKILTCQYPKLIHHRKVPILQDPVRREDQPRRIYKTHENEEPESCPEISRNE